MCNTWLYISTLKTPTFAKYGDRYLTILRGGYIGWYVGSNQGKSAFNIACTSSATAMRENSNCGLVWTIPLLWSRMCSRVAAMSISLQPLAIRFRTMSIKTYVPVRPTPSLELQSSENWITSYVLLNWWFWYLYRLFAFRTVTQSIVLLCIQLQYSRSIYLQWIAIGHDRPRYDLLTFLR